MTIARRQERHKQWWIQSNIQGFAGAPKQASIDALTDEILLLPLSPGHAASQCLNATESCVFHASAQASQQRGQLLPLSIAAMQHLACMMLIEVDFTQHQLHRKQS
jgi:hypothetical protein